MKENPNGEAMAGEIKRGELNGGIRGALLQKAEALRREAHDLETLAYKHLDDTWDLECQGALYRLLFR